MKVLKRAGLKKVLVILGILFFPLIMGLSTAPAEDKTPPYTGWTPAGPFQPFKKSPPQPEKTPVKAAVTVEKPVEEERPVEMPPDTGDYQTEEYVVQEGDWIAKILRKKGVLKEDNLSELLAILRKFNQTMKDFNLIRPGEKIVILVKVAPGAKPSSPPAKEKPAPLRISTPAPPKQQPTPVARGLKSEPYRIKRGDILSRVVVNRYDLSARTFASEYLDLFKNAIHPSKIRTGSFPGRPSTCPFIPHSGMKRPLHRRHSPPS